MNDSPGKTPRGRKRFGRSLVIAIVLLAAAAWQVFRLVRRPETRPLPSAPAGVAVGVPRRPLRFAAYNIYHNYRGMDGTVAEVRKVDPPPDFLLLSEVERQHVAPMGDALAMRYRYFPLLRHSPGQPAWPDVAILSRHRLFEGRVLCTADGHPFGLWVNAVVDDRKFAVAGVHLWPTFGIDPRHVIETANMRHRQLEVMLSTWREAGAPPLVVAGDFNQPALGENYALMTRDLNDTLASLGQTGATFGKRLLQVRIDYVLATPQWQPLAGGVIQGNASDHRPVWVDVKGADDGAATRRAGARFRSVIGIEISDRRFPSPLTPALSRACRERGRGVGYNGIQAAILMVEPAIVPLIFTW